MISPNKPTTIVFTLFLLIVSYSISAQKLPKDISTWQNNMANLENEKFQSDFNYFSGFGEHQSLDTAKRRAYEEIMVKIANSQGMVYDVNIGSNSKTVNTTINQDVNVRIDFEYETNIQGERKKVKVDCMREVESFYAKEDGRYRYCVLVRMPKTGKSALCNADFYRSFGADPIWRSAILPGWGQFFKYSQTSYNPEKTKGVIFLSLGGVSISGLVVSQLMYTKYYDLSKTSNSLAAMRDYDDKATNWQSMRNYAAIATVGVYVVNIIEVASSKGAKLYASKNKPFKISPTVYPGGGGLAFVINLDK